MTKRKAVILKKPLQAGSVESQAKNNFTGLPVVSAEGESLCLRKEKHFKKFFTPSETAKK